VAAPLLYGFWWEPDSLRVREYDVTVDAPALKGLSIAVIADLHAGAPYIDGAKIERVVAETNAARPDLILLAGDYVSERGDGSLRMPLEDLAAHLQGLDAPLGVYAVLGNHDDTVGGRRVAAALGQAGILVLNNTHAVVGRRKGLLIVAGIDTWTGPADGREALRGLEQQKVLCLTHMPYLFPRLPPACVLTVAGHTHGGQVALPPVREWALRRTSRHGPWYDQGVIGEGGRTLFVSPGIGTTALPVRLGVPPEISLLKIR
jgi:predicted MPP superfamily phosphohydrolase